jgi:branched-chain amino acid transport system permease protein
MVVGAIALAALLTVPHFLSFHHQDLLIFLTINVLAVCSYRLVTLTGEWSLIHAVMMGVGAYTVALLVNHFDLAIWFTLPLAGTAAGLVAALLCFPLLRMTQFYFLIGSFAAGEAIRLTWVEFVGVFGGTSGLRGVEAPIVFGIDFLDPIPYFYFSLEVGTGRVGRRRRLALSRAGFYPGFVFRRYRRRIENPLPRQRYAKPVHRRLHGIYSDLGDCRGI